MPGCGVGTGAEVGGTTTLDVGVTLPETVIKRLSCVPFNVGVTSIRLLQMVLWIYVPVRIRGGARRGYVQIDINCSQNGCFVAGLISHIYANVHQYLS